MEKLNESVPRASAGIMSKKVYEKFVCAHGEMYASEKVVITIEHDALGEVD